MASSKNNSNTATGDNGDISGNGTAPLAQSAPPTFVPIPFAYIKMLPDDFSEWVRESKRFAQDENNPCKDNILFTFPKLSASELESLCDQLNVALQELSYVWYLFDVTHTSPASSISIHIDDDALYIDVIPPASSGAKTNNPRIVNQVIADTSRPVMSCFPSIGAGSNMTDYAVYVILSVSWELISLGEMDINIDNWTYDPLYNPLFGAMRLYDGPFKDIRDGWTKICKNAMFTINLPTLWSYLICSHRYHLERKMNDAMKDIMRALVHMVDARRPGVDGNNGDIRASFLMTVLPFFTAVMARREPFTYNAISFITGCEPETFGMNHIDGVDYSLVPFECDSGTWWPEKVTSDMRERDGWADTDLPQDALPYKSLSELERLCRIVKAAVEIWKTVATPEVEDEVVTMISDWLLDEPNWERDLGFLARKLSISDAIELAQDGVPLEDIIA